MERRELPPNYSGGVWLNSEEEIKQFETERKIKIKRAGLSPKVGDMLSVGAGDNILWGKVLSVNDVGSENEIELEYVGE